MTYFGVLLRFIGPPLILLAAATIYDLRRGLRIQPSFRTWSPWAILFGHVGIALAYTTPWDNYLVANRIWWYEPSLVTGITLGWVPIEEYTFFVVQTLLSGLWLLFWMRRMRSGYAILDCRDPSRAGCCSRRIARSGEPSRAEPDGQQPERMNPSHALRWAAAGAVAALWIVWLGLLLSGWQKGLYMALLLVWALPPIALQLGFGADILWRYRRLVLVGLLPPFLYLCLVDAIAIYGSTWTINPQNTVGVDVFGVLPLEEIVFFLLTNVLIVFGIILMLARESHLRARLRTVAVKSTAREEP